VAGAVLEILRQEGVEVFLDTEAASVMQNQSGEIVLEIAAGQEKHTLTGSHLLVATGRTPNSDTLHLEKAGVAVDSKGFIIVNERLETTVPGIYAAGDVKGGPAFTHISYDDYRILRENLLENGSRTTRERPVPYVLYTDPQLGRIGLSERQAKAEGLNYRVTKMPMSHVARAIETGRTEGFMKALVDAESRQILGAAILGVEGGEIMSMLQIAMMGRLPYTALREAIFAHPTYAESLNNLFASLE
jgi:pyruvate/2-oxoglutarate dehydrogenase complex dihydrolipoamide dehydrogenase (E3) component